MIFSFSIGSIGTKEELFSLHLPLVFSPGRNINIGGKKHESEFKGRKFTIEKHRHLYSLKIFPFNSYVEAQSFIGDLSASIYWISLKHKIGIKIPNELDKVKLYEEPIAVLEKSNIYEMMNKIGWNSVDGDYDVDKLVIVPEQKHLTVYEYGNATVTIGFGPDNFINDLIQSLNYPTINKVLENKKLWLAIELYSSFAFAVTDTTKFIILVTVLESLLPKKNTVSPETLTFINKAIDFLKAERKKLQTNSQEVDDIRRLIDRIGNLSEQPKGQTIVSYVNSLITSLPSLDIDKEIILKLKRAYKIRGSLLHNGKNKESELKDSLAVLSEFIPELLICLFKDCANNFET